MPSDSSVAGSLRPFWRYYGGKWRAAPKYPAPRFDTIVEPFAGAAGYSCRYPDRKVILVDKYPVIAGIWRYLIGVSAAEIRRIPEVDAIADLPAWVPQEARWLVGFWLNAGVVSPKLTLSAGRRRLAAAGRKFEGWTPATRNRIATQVDQIRHWQIIEGDWWDAPAVRGTWFVDPPYNNRAGSHYVHAGIDYEGLGQLCHLLAGGRCQVIACENEGATWLPFEPFGTFHENKMSGVAGGSQEVVWLS